MIIEDSVTLRGIDPECKSGLCGVQLGLGKRPRVMSCSPMRSFSQTPPSHGSMDTTDTESLLLTSTEEDVSTQYSSDYSISTRSVSPLREDSCLGIRSLSSSPRTWSSPSATFSLNRRLESVYPQPFISTRGGFIQMQSRPDLSTLDSQFPRSIFQSPSPKRTYNCPVNPFDF